MKHRPFIAMTIAATLGCGWAARAESPSVLLEKGIHTEETAGDLDAAIQIYGQIIADAQANRPFVAQAYYRLGMCYLKKQSQPEAVAAFKKVLTDFPEQASTFAKARRELAKLAPGDGPPVVLCTNPPAFADDVSPSLKKITVTFDRPMMDQSWSWTGGGETYPKTTGKISYDPTKMTCTLPVALEPGKAYWVGINSPSHNGFRSPDGVRAQRYVILFATKTADGKSTSIPDDMAAKAKEVNSVVVQKAEPQAAKPLEIGPAPWQDGELMQLAIKTAAGGEAGTLIWTAQTAKVEQKEIWRIQSYMETVGFEMEQYTRVDAQHDNFTPITGRSKNQMGDFRANYASDKVALAVKAKGKELTREVPVSSSVYDNEEALYLIRRLPLAEGYCASFTIFPVQGGATCECRIQVTGKESVTVPTGTYDCYKVNLAVYTGVVRALEHQLWFSADKSKYLVKYDAGTATMELSRVGTIEKDKPARFEGKEIGVSVTAPAGWYFYSHPTPAPYKALVQLLPPELQAWCLLTVGEPEPSSSSKSARQVAEGDVEQLKGYFKGYAPRPDSWSDLTIAGIPASRFAADYEHEAQKMVEYRTYLLGKSATYWFVFRIEKDAFESMKPVFDSIVTGFQVK